VLWILEFTTQLDDSLVSTFVSLTVLLTLLTELIVLDHNEPGADISVYGH